MGASRDAYLESVAKSADEFAAEMERDARRSIKANLVLDQFALQEKLGVDDAELTSFVVQQAQRMGVSPDQLAAHLRDSGQIGSAVSDVLRAKALDLIVRRAAIKDASGREVDLAALAASEQAADEQAADEQAADEQAADEQAAERAADEGAAAERGGQAPDSPTADAGGADAAEVEGTEDARDAESTPDEPDQAAAQG